MKYFWFEKHAKKILPSNVCWWTVPFSTLVSIQFIQVQIDFRIYDDSIEVFMQILGIILYDI